jgi:uncharacterized protein YecT (DUF1311 family)
MKLITILFFCFFYYKSFSQSEITLKNLETKYKTCLDKGEFILGCTSIFYQEMDSLLNLYYNQIMKESDSLQKENLKDEQLNWLEKRDKNFISSEKKIKKEAKKLGYNGGQIELLEILDQKSTFVKIRVKELTNKKPENYSPKNYKVNLGGFYSLNSKKEIKNGETYGYFGDILIRPITENKFEVKLFVCKGYPSYNSGTINDTFLILDNKAIYKNIESDSTCKIIFSFYKRGIKIEEITDNYNSGCGFGHAVVANGFFKRKSNRIPTKKEMKE